MANGRLRFTVWHYIFAVSDFCDFCRGFFFTTRKKSSFKKIAAKIFSAKVYSAVEIIFKHHLLHEMENRVGVHILKTSLSFRNKRN